MVTSTSMQVAGIRARLAATCQALAQNYGVPLHRLAHQERRVSDDAVEEDHTSGGGGLSTKLRRAAFGGTVVLIGVLSACASATQAPAATAGPSDCATVACQMTQDSGVDGIPVPAKSVGYLRLGIMHWNANGSVSDLVAFYKVYMSGHGWTYDTQNSRIDPDIMFAKIGAYQAEEIWCSSKVSSPKWDAIFVTLEHPSTDRATNPATVVSIVELPDTDPCPGN
jgi:hypothetical protein